MSRSDLKGLQPECCMLCGRAVAQDRLFISQVQGLRGRVICDQHKGFGTKPSYEDINRLGRRIPAVDIQRRQPIGSSLEMYTDDPDVVTISLGNTTWQDDFP